MKGCCSFPLLKYSCKVFTLIRRSMVYGRYVVCRLDDCVVQSSECNSVGLGGWEGTCIYIEPCLITVSKNALISFGSELDIASSGHKDVLSL